MGKKIKEILSKKKLLRIKGLTLIELLAIIVILGIIALIAVPVVLNIINNTRRNAFKVGVYSVFNAYKYKEAESNFSNIGELDISEVNLSNDKYSIGKIKRDSEKRVEVINVSDGVYCANGILENLNITEGDCSIFDETPPEISNISITKTTSTVRVIVSFSEPDSVIKNYEFRLLDNNDNVIRDWVKGDSLTGRSLNRVTTKTFNKLIQGETYKVEVRITNSSKNENDTTIDNKVVTLNRINRPEITYNTSSYKKNKVVTLTYDEGITTRYKIVNSELETVIDWTTLTGVNTDITISDYDYTIYIESSDGTTTLSNSTLVGYIDYTSPIVAISNIDENWSTNDEVTLNLSDNRAGIDEWCITNVNDSDECVWNTIPLTLNTDIKYTITNNGNYYVFAKDIVGNISQVQEFNINKIDTLVPEVNIIGIQNPTNRSLTANVTSGTSISGYTYKWYKDGVLISNATNSTYLTDTSGVYKVEVNTVARGNSGATPVMSMEYTINSYAITYNNNGGTSTLGTQIKIEGISTNVSNTIPTRSGYTFLGWGTSANDTSVDYSAGSVIANNANLNLYAIWKKTITITFNANGASLSYTSKTCDMYNADTSCSITSPTISRSGYDAIGFNTSSSATTSSWNQNTAANVNSNATYYAITKVSYSCPNGGTLTVNTSYSSSTGGYICVTSASSSCNTTYYSCDHTESVYSSDSSCGYASCTYTYNATRGSCPSGSSWNGSSCTRAASADCSHSLYDVVGSSCVRYRDYSSCKNGGSFPCAGSGVTSCLNQYCTSGLTNANWSCSSSGSCSATMPVIYSCPSGFSRSGSTCYKSPSYSCPNGGSLSGTTCTKNGQHSSCGYSSCWHNETVYGSDSSCGSYCNGYTYYCPYGWSNYSGSGSSLNCYKSATN